MFLAFLTFSSLAQSLSDNYCNGLHLGLTGSGNLAQKINVNQYSGSFPAPIYKNGIGWNAGAELSYHFYNYFGISMGFSYGTICQYRFSVFTPFSRYFSDGHDRYDNKKNYCVKRFQIPIRLEFHIPFRQSKWMFYSSVGINLQNTLESIGYALHKEDYYSFLLSTDIYMMADESDDTGEMELFYKDILQNNEGYKIRTDMTMNMGIYYRLPFSSLIRASICMNFSFKEQLSGYYEFPADNTYGTLSYLHNYIGLELAYLYCFRTKAQKAKSLLDKN